MSKSPPPVHDNHHQRHAVPLHILNEEQLPHANIYGRRCDGDCTPEDLPPPGLPPDIEAVLTSKQADALYAIAVCGLSIKEYARLEGVYFEAARKRYNSAIKKARAALEAVA